MEIIKQIKAAEAEAKEIIEKAKSDAIKIAEEFSANRESQIAQASEQRRKAIESAVAQAETQAKTEVEKLMAEGVGQKEQMQNQARSKMDGAVSKVVNKLKAI